MHKYIGSAFIILMGAFQATAQAKECPVDKAMSSEWILMSRISAEVAKNSMSVLESFQNLMNSRDWDDDLSMGEQMTSAEADKFSRLRQQLTTSELSALIASKRERDIRTIGRMAEIAELLAEQSQTFNPEEESEDFILLAFLELGREMIPVDENQSVLRIETDGSCTFRNSLVLAAQKAENEANNYPLLQPALDEFDRLAKSYPSGFDDISALSPRDRKSLEEVRSIIYGAKSYLILSRDYQRLAIMEESSSLLYEAAKQDQFQRAGDIDNVGATWKRWIDDGIIKKESEAAAALIHVLNEHVPSEWSNQHAIFESISREAIPE